MKSTHIVVHLWVVDIVVNKNHSYTLFFMDSFGWVSLKLNYFQNSLHNLNQILIWISSSVVSRSREKSFHEGSCFTAKISIQLINHLIFKQLNRQLDEGWSPDLWCCQDLVLAPVPSAPSYISLSRLNFFYFALIWKHCCSVRSCAAVHGNELVQCNSVFPLE